MLALLGAAAMAFSIFGLVMTWLQELLSRRLPVNAEFHEAQRALWTVWRSHLPLWFLGGIALAICGWRLRALAKASIPLARLGCVLALVAVTLSIVDIWYRALPAMEPLFATHPFLPRGSFRPFAAISSVGSLLMVGTPFGVMLWGLCSRTK